MGSRSTHLSAWVSAETKQRFGLLASQSGLSESALLKRLVDLTIQSTRMPETIDLPTTPLKVMRDTRLYVRLRREDHLFLRERGASRGIAAATYVSILVRAHLRSVAPIPDRELSELKHSVATLRIIGSNLNQIARVANQTGRVTGPALADLRAVLRACEALRVHVKDLIRANTASWETGNAEARH